jgi:cell division protein FtsZ
MNQDEFGISFDMPKNKSNVIKVIGVGGGGSNAIKHMFQQGINGVDFVICNTDAQALENSPVPNKIQLGVSLTEGLGAGANPEVGEKAAQESIDDVRAMLDSNTKMVFITAGMGGGTGTGAAPVIAQMAKQMDILTVGIVTTPFQFEGKVRNEQAQRGIEKLRENVDSMVVINNNKLREVYGNLGFKAGFSKADEVLATASRGIAEVITHHYTQNIDLRDAKTVLANSGTAIMGSAQASGQNRAHEGIVKALDSPLLNDNKITGAKNVLLLIVSGTNEITIDEIGEINDLIQDEAGGNANIIMGIGEDESLGEDISITVIATGFDVEQQNEITNIETKRIIHTLEDEQQATHDLDKPLNNIKISGSRSAVSNIQQREPVDEEPLETDTPDEPKKVVHNLTDENQDDEDIAFAKAQNEEQSTVNEEVKDEAGDSEDHLEFQFTITDEDEPESSNDEQAEIGFDFTEEVEQQQLEKKVYHLEEDTEAETQWQPKDMPIRSLESEKESAGDNDEIRVIQKEEQVSPVQKESVKKPADSRENPMDLPINEALKLGAEERKRKLHKYNHQFKNRQRIEEIERQPAYLRQGIELEGRDKESKISQTSIGEDANGEPTLRKGNSFLHDNVD